MDPFITVDELGAYLSPRSPRDLTEDALAALAIEGACTAIRTATEQQLTFVEDDTVTFEGGGRRDLLLPEVPVVEVDEVRLVDGDGESEITVEWRLMASGILRRHAALWASPGPDWPSGYTVEVDYSHGFADDAFPADLKLLALTVAARHYQQGIVRQESTGSASATYSVSAASDFSSGERALLAKYRHPRAAHLAAAVGS